MNELDLVRRRKRVYEAFDLEGHRWSFHQHTGRRFAFEDPFEEDGDEDA